MQVSFIEAADQQVLDQRWLHLKDSVFAQNLQSCPGFEKPFVRLQGLNLDAVSMFNGNNDFRTSMESSPIPSAPIEVLELMLDRSMW